MRLEIGPLFSWFENPMKSYTKHVSWYYRNYTNTNLGLDRQGLSGPITPATRDQNAMYQTELDLWIIGYREARDEERKKFVPQHRVLARIARFSNICPLSDRSEK